VINRGGREGHSTNRFTTKARSHEEYKGELFTLAFLRGFVTSWLYGFHLNLARRGRAGDRNLHNTEVKETSHEGVIA
jgi:hypothetical protein